MSNRLDLDQDRRSLGPDLGPNYLQRLARKEFNECEMCALTTL